MYTRWSSPNGSSLPAAPAHGEHLDRTPSIVSPGRRSGPVPHFHASALERLQRKIERMPKTVAVIGASSNRNKYGNKALRAYERQGHAVLAINPNESVVEGHQTYPSVLDVPGPIDMATIYVQPHVAVKVLAEIAQKGIPEVWLNPGADTPEVVATARELGVRTIQACSIMGIGERPGRY